MKNEDYIKAIEKLNEEYMSLYNSKVLKKARKKEKIKAGIRRLEFKHLFFELWLRMKGYNRNTKVNSLVSVKSKKRNGKRVVYTCIVGGYDQLLSPLISTPNTDYIVFSDNENITQNSNVWKYRSIPSNIKKKCHNNSTLINRYIKMHPKELFEGYDLSLYIDGSVKIISDIAECFYYINDNTGFAMHVHHSRTDVYEEAQACITVKRGNIKAIKELIKKYEYEKVPHDLGLLEATIIASDLNNPMVTKLFNEWYDKFIESNTMRDQLVLPYILWKNGLSSKDAGILGTSITKNYKFRWLEHPVSITRKSSSLTKKITKRLLNYGIKYKCNICHSNLKSFIGDNTCPVCKSDSDKRLLYFYFISNKSLLKNNRKILFFYDYSVIKYKLNKNKNILIYSSFFTDFYGHYKDDLFDFLVCGILNSSLNKKLLLELKRILKQDGKILMLNLSEDDQLTLKKFGFNVDIFNFSNKDKFGIKESSLLYIVKK